LLAVLCSAATGAQLPDGLYAEITTTKGVIVARLEPEKTPLAVASFVGLAEGTIANDAYPEGSPYYDGSVFHRVVDGHVIQAGAPDPQRSDARGPGYEYPNEIHADLSHDHAGALGVANSGPHTNGAQFYITLGDRSYLDGTYIVFGEVVEGIDVVHAIVQGDLVESVRIVRRGAEAQAYAVDTARFQELVAAAEERVQLAEVQRELRLRQWIRGNFGDRLMYADGQRVFRRRRGAGEPVEPGDRIRVRYFATAVVYRGHMIGYTGPLFEEVRFAGSAEDGRPQTDDLDPPPFEYEVGSTSVTAGFDRAVAGMRRGDETLVVVDWRQAYADRGFYGPDRPGEPRFVIPPYTTVIYAIEVLDR
jgi:peptidylprolyl isomerase